MKNTIGIIANPQSGRDIRRLIAHASVFDNMEKANIVERLLTVFEKLGIKKVLAMPDGFGIVTTALYSLCSININVEFIDMRTWDSWEDTYEAAKIMKDECDVIVVIGGDGTNRIVAKVVNDTPIMPISTGTNNTFPYMIEATIAGEAAASIALGVVNKDEATHKSKKIELFENGVMKDIALIDAAATNYSFVGARAIWEPQSLYELVLSKASPANIGLSSIGGILREIDDEDIGMYVEFGKGRKIKAPISPGVLREIEVKDYKIVSLGEEINLKTTSALFALDGEREVYFEGKIKAHIIREGPAVIDYKKTLKLASERGLFKID
ncbi:ATP-NAD kinase [bacterium]|nr:ATP-NAD kinase [bacterium]